MKLLRHLPARRALAMSGLCLAALAAGTTYAVADAPRSPSGPTDRTSVVTTTTVSDPDDVDGRFDIASVASRGQRSRSPPRLGELHGLDVSQLGRPPARPPVPQLRARAQPRR